MLCWSQGQYLDWSIVPAKKTIYATECQESSDVFLDRACVQVHMTLSGKELDQWQHLGQVLFDGSSGVRSPRYGRFHDLFPPFLGFFSTPLVLFNATTSLLVGLK